MAAKNSDALHFPVFVCENIVLPQFFLCIVKARLVINLEYCQARAQKLQLFTIDKVVASLALCQLQRD